MESSQSKRPHKDQLAALAPENLQGSKGKVHVPEAGRSAKFNRLRFFGRIG